ncbi:MAG: HEAT repeat domain-containing protein [Planctomycetota bacterium]
MPRGAGSRALGTLTSRLPPAIGLGLGLLLAVLPACSGRMKKLSTSGSIADTLFYDILDRDRAPRYYYSLVRSSHRERDFCYTCREDDPYLVDKNIDAVQRLGHANFGRLEGVAEVVELFSEVIMEDCAALARASAATSLTEIGLKLPRYDVRQIRDDGKKLLALMQRVDGIYDRTKKSGSCSPGDRQAVIQALREIGDLQFSSIDFRFYRQSLRFFYGRAYLVDEEDPVVREAIDTALTKRIVDLIRVSLQAAVDDPVADVRSSALTGLKIHGDSSAADTVTQRMEYETNWLVRMDAVEYLGRVGGRQAVRTLVPMLDDPNASVRHKVRQSLVRIAGEDMGFRRRAWEQWARAKDPTIEFGSAKEGDEDAEDAFPGA